MLIRQLTYRFGPLPQWARVRLNAADSAQLEAWFDASLDARSLTDVLGPAEGH
ncbi:MAG: DUF4351 domain-containing protein [Azoarcus sp.]|nr:DUF4351 domain-containing protein [Azoarcus sp.]